MRKITTGEFPRTTYYRFMQYAPFAIVVAAIFIYFAYVAAFGVNVLFWDEWDLIRLFPAFANGTLPLRDLLLAKHNEHIMPVSYAFMLLHHLIFDINDKALLFTDCIIQALSTGVLLILIRQVAVQKTIHMWTAAWVVLLMFSLGQYTNLLWGFQNAWFLVTLFFFLAIYFLEKMTSARRCWPYLALASMFAILGSFSSTQGLIIWFSGAVFIVIKDDLKPADLFRKKAIWLWAVQGALCVVVYIVINKLDSAGAPSHNVPLSWWAANIKAIVLCGLQALGSFLPDTTSLGCALVGVVIGGYALAALVAVAYSPKPSNHALPACLIAFGLCFALLIAIGRSPLGNRAGMESRYSAYEIFVLIGILLIFFRNDLMVKHRQTFAWNILRGSYAAFLVIVYTVSAYNALVHGRQLRLERGIGASVLVDYKNEPRFMIERMLYADTELVLKLAPYLQTRHLNVFAGGIDALPRQALIYQDPPNTYKRVMQAFPDRSLALSRLWEVYRAGADLRDAFDVSSDDFAENLIHWSVGASADSGQHYLSGYFASYHNDYLFIWQQISKSSQIKTEQ